MKKKFALNSLKLFDGRCLIHWRYHDCLHIGLAKILQNVVNFFCNQYEQHQDFHNEDDRTIFGPFLLIPHLDKAHISLWPRQNSCIDRSKIVG